MFGSSHVGRELGIQIECLPPNCTPVLQPCDQHVNALFKRYYHYEWYEWYRKKGHLDQTQPGNKHSRLRRAKEKRVNRWIANTIARLQRTKPDEQEQKDEKEAVRKEQPAKRSAIQDSWEETLIAEPHLMRVPDRVWQRIEPMVNKHIFAQVSPQRSSNDMAASFSFL